MHEELPRPALRFRLRSHLSTFDALKKGPCKLPFARMALAVNRAEIEELVTERVPFLVLGKSALQGKSQLA